MRINDMTHNNYRNVGGSPFSSVVTLASWRLRRTWFLLLITTLGMITAVVVTCAVPLFSTITTTESVRSTLRAQAYSSQFEFDTSPIGLSSRLVHDVQQQVDAPFQQNLSKYMSGSTQVGLAADNVNIVSPKPQLGSAGYALHVQAAPMTQLASHIQLVQGRMPRVTSDPAHEIEILVTADNAKPLHVHVGSVMNLSLPYFTQLPDVTQDGFMQNANSIVFKAHVVGLFKVNTEEIDYWHGKDFTFYATGSGPSVVLQYSMLVPSEGFLGIYDGLGAKYHIAAPFSIFGDALSFYYNLDPRRVSVTQLNDLITHVANTKSFIDTHYADTAGFYGYYYDPYNPPSYPYVTHVYLISPLLSNPGEPSNLEQARTSINVSSVPTFVLSLQILALILFFVSLMTDLLVDRQSDAIAILRSRGASRGQIFGALLTQCAGLGLVAIVIGLPLTLVVVLAVSQHILPLNAQDAINMVTNNPLQSIISILGYGTAVVLVVLATMSISLARAARMDVLSVRRDASRSSRLPLWQRLNLDVFAGVIALAGYGVSLYLTSVGTTLSGTAKAVIAVPLSLIAPFFLVLGCLLLFLRFFPLFLRAGASFAVKSRSAVSMLALAQMARAPRQAVRMTLLLALATAFALFSLVYTASQEQHVNDVAINQVGADFGGTISTQLLSYQLSPQEESAQYQRIAGVTLASAGFIATANVAEGNVPLNIQMRAVDTQTFGKTALWPSGASTQPLNTLLSLLDTKRAYGISHTVVPVVVDETVKNKLALHVGSTFAVTVNAQASSDPLLVSDMPCVVVATVQSIPATNTTTADANSRYYTPTGGMLLDYRTYSAVYGQEAQVLGGKGKSIPLNYIWLRTTNDAAQLTRIRAILANGNSLILINLVDRRAILDMLHSDPLTITLIGILSIGTVATLLLAIVGDLLASWLSARTRLTNFAVLRALGTSPRQVASVLTWEQALVYIIGVLLGIAFGSLLATTVSPTLIANSSSLQSGLPTHLVIPLSLILAFLAVVVIFVFALGMMVRIVSQPSMSQTLRLNED